MKVRHLILDRDGVLTREPADGGWTVRPEDLRWERNALEGLRTLCQGRRVSIATNQSCVGRGIVGLDAVRAVNERLVADALAAGARIDAFFVCPHAPDAGCACRKPEPGLLLDAIAASGIPADETLFVGDSAKDLEAGRRAGVAVALVRTGKGTRTASTGAAAGVEVLDDLAELAAWLAGPGDQEAPVGIAAIFAEHQRVLAESAAVLPPVLERAAEIIGVALRGGGRVFVCGNGGSAADAQHFAAELVGRFEAERRALPALALTTDSSALTAIANDHGFELVFARQIEAFAREGDVLIALSTSGRSPNVLAAARVARELGCAVIALTGEGGGPLGEACDLLVAVPSTNVARVQEVHGVCLHALAQAIERSVTP